MISKPALCCKSTNWLIKSHQSERCSNTRHKTLTSEVWEYSSSAAPLGEKSPIHWVLLYHLPRLLSIFFPLSGSAFPISLNPLPLFLFVLHYPPPAVCLPLTAPAVSILGSFYKHTCFSSVILYVFVHAWSHVRLFFQSVCKKVPNLPWDLFVGWVMFSL